ncbi:hypothetical protein BOTBODRAFT_43008 [Botryobasidium botryosum FD-172 SS1]|uniref:Uncharacterized protein n=1 Tax=Botryobasidium botryosum (strain FD-172 SS1) TaxID=930990 RepID=A0A067MPA4_BOTB1|nr:hypothetical protein BOTBODRAFT_43008 [Botryobasidium botryosum FD-172 SS1]
MQPSQTCTCGNCDSCQRRRHCWQQSLHTGTVSSSPELPSSKLPTSSNTHSPWSSNNDAPAAPPLRLLDLDQPDRHHSSALSPMDMDPQPSSNHQMGSPPPASPPVSLSKSHESSLSINLDPSEVDWLQREELEQQHREEQEADNEEQECDINERNGNGEEALRDRIAKAMMGMDAYIQGLDELADAQEVDIDLQQEMEIHDAMDLEPS